MPNLDSQIQHQQIALDMARSQKDKESELTAALALIELYKQNKQKDMQAAYLAYVSACYQTDFSPPNFIKAIDYIEQALVI